MTEGPALLVCAPPASLLIIVISSFPSPHRVYCLNMDVFSHCLHSLEQLPGGDKRCPTLPTSQTGCETGGLWGPVKDDRWTNSMLTIFLHYYKGSNYLAVCF